MHLFSSLTPRINKMESERELKTITKLDENVHHMSILMSPEVCWIIPNMMFSQFDVMRVS